jgi:hypothetical protein
MHILVTRFDIPYFLFLLLLYYFFYITKKGEEMGADGHEGVLDQKDKNDARNEWLKYSYGGTYLGHHKPFYVRLKDIVFHDHPIYLNQKDAESNVTSNKWDQIAHAYRFKTGLGDEDWSCYWQGTTPS